jgi:RNA polymerase sigma-70 factor (ECF subfamily)
MKQDLQKKLCHEIVNKDVEAFTDIYLAYNALLKRFIYTYTFDYSLADDIVQETFMLLWEIRGKIDPEKSLLSFLLTIAKNKALNELKKQKSNLNTNTKYQVLKLREIELNIQSLEYLNPHDLIVKEIEDKVRKTLSELPSKTREIFEMSRYQGIKNKDIAEQLNICIKTVEYHLSKALSELRVKVIQD